MAGAAGTIERNQPGALLGSVTRGNRSIWVPSACYSRLSVKAFFHSRFLLGKQRERGIIMTTAMSTSMQTGEQSAFT